MTRSHKRRLKFITNKLKEDTSLISNSEMIKQLEALPRNSKNSFMYVALKQQFIGYFFHVEFKKLFDKNGLYYEYLISDEPEEYIDRADEDDELKLMFDNLDRLTELENQIFEEWLVSSGFVKVVFKATKGHKPSYDKVKKESARFNRAGINLSHRELNETQGRDVWPSDIPQDLEIMYQEMRKKIEAKGEINL